MKTEYEAKFLSINSTQIHDKLTSLGARCIHPRVLMKRVLFDHPTLKNAFIRIRDEGDRITMTGKHIIDEKKVDGMREIEFEVDDFNNAKAFINFLGMETRSYQETYREQWRLGDVEFSIDEWPGINPFIEIEGPNEETVRGVCAQLELNFSQAYFGAVDVIYEQTL